MDGLFFLLFVSRWAQSKRVKFQVSKRGATDSAGESPGGSPSGLLAELADSRVGPTGGSRFLCRGAFRLLKGLHVTVAGGRAARDSVIIRAQAAAVFVGLS